MMKLAKNLGQEKVCPGVLGGSEKKTTQSCFRFVQIIGRDRALGLLEKVSRPQQAVAKGQ
jgi:hypothetical protein